MGHSGEQFYNKAKVLHDKALELHRERYKVAGEYDQMRCKVLLDDVRALALDIRYGQIDFDIDFGKEHK